MRASLSSPRPMSVPRGYFPSLDGLRALSIVPVVWHHSTPRPYSGWLGRGPIGVDLFFAISGFLITTLLLRERAARGRVDLKAFYVRRSCRIFPLYYLALALHLLFASVIRPEWGPCRAFLQRWPAYATYTANWLDPASVAGPVLFAFAWSLCIEEQFYAFWAPIVACIRSAWIPACLIGAWLLIDLALEFSNVHVLGASDALGVRVLKSFATPIGVGALLAMLGHYQGTAAWLRRLIDRRSASLVIGAFTLSLIAKPWAPVPILHFALGLLVFSCAVRRDHVLAPLLEHGVMRFVGRISYGIYLWHVPVIGAVRAVSPGMRANAGLVFALALPLSIAVAAASYSILEQPCIQWGARLLKRKRDDAAAYDENTSLASASTVSSSAQ